MKLNLRGDDQKPNRDVKGRIRRGGRPRWVGHTWFPFVSLQSRRGRRGREVVEWRVRGESEQGVTYHIRSKWKGRNRRRIGLGNLMRQGGKHWQITRQLWVGYLMLREPLWPTLPCRFGVLGGISVVFPKIWIGRKKHTIWHQKISKESKLLTFASGLNFGENDQSWRHFHSRPPLLHLVLCLHQTVLNSHRSLTLSLWQSWWWYAADQKIKVKWLTW